MKNRKNHLRLVKATDIYEGVRVTLVAYDKHEATHAGMVERVVLASSREATAIIEDWLERQDELKLSVGREVVKVTPNSPDKASLVDIDWAKQISGYLPNNAGTLGERRNAYIKRCLNFKKKTRQQFTAEEAAEQFDRIYLRGEMIW